MVQRLWQAMTLGILMPAALLGASVADARPRHARASLVVAASDGQPLTRIRGVDQGQGLTPTGFARWLTRHPQAIASRDGPPLLVLASTTGMLNRTAIAFARADRDGDGRVSPVELADFVVAGGRAAPLL